MGGFCRFFESKWHLKDCVAVAGGGMVDRKKEGWPQEFCVRVADGECRLRVVGAVCESACMLSGCRRDGWGGKRVGLLTDEASAAMMGVVAYSPKSVISTIYFQK